jgi:hypothetical protein
MQITLEIPDDLAPPLLPPGRKPARVALEAMALEAYRMVLMTSRAIAP